MKEIGRKIKAAGRSSYLFKMIFIGVLILVFLIPLGMIRGLIHEREETRAYAENDIIHSWGGEQSIAGPLLIVPYITRIKDEKGHIEEYTEMAYFLPDSLEISGEATPEKRSRGIYEVTLYSSILTITGLMSGADFSDWRIAGNDILWDEAILAVELPGMHGLQERVELSWGDRSIPFQAGKGALGLHGGQIWAPLTNVNALNPGEQIPFSFVLQLQGGRSLGFLPLGEETRVHLNSPWPSPSFNGAFLPSARTLDDTGFNADWYVLSLGRSYPQKWRQGEIDPFTLGSSQFGVDLMIPVDSYQKVLRSVKYGILFILLPFLTLFLFEIFSRRREESQQIHPLQYLLIGFADCLFYLLLLSISEHISFGVTYVLASVATIALITFYACAVLSTWKRGMIMAPVLTAAYLFLFAVLHSEDYALLIGSLGLFLILAAIMILTRGIDWYALGRNSEPSSPGPSTPEQSGPKTLSPEPPAKI